VHPFWLSHEEIRPWLELSMGGGHGRSWSSMGGTMAELAGEEREGEGEGAQLRGARGCRRGGLARAALCCLPVHDCLL
jgi:hypothetical protein